MADMALELDTSRQLRSISELTNLVHAISSAPSTESEPDWLEWKREADLSDRRWHARIAKFIAGFANRDPAVAKLQAGGCGYLVIGAEPGNVVGVSPIDNADLHSGVARFIRNTVRWNPHYVSHCEKQILVVTVEPPEMGDRVTAILRQYTDMTGAMECRKGDVFVRRSGKTELATQEDYDVLVERHGAGNAKASGLTVLATEPVTAIVFGCTPDEVDTWRQREEQSLLEPLEQWATREPGQRWPTGLATVEKRSHDEYRREVAGYLDEVVRLLPSQARARAIEGRPPSLNLVLVNETEDNFAAVRVNVAIPGEIQAHNNALHALPMMPARPHPWCPTVGLENSGAVSGILHFDDLSAPSEQGLLRPIFNDSGSAPMEFGDIDLRPGQSVRFAPVYLTADAELAGKTLVAEWTATSTSTSGMARGWIPVEVSTEVVSPLLDPIER